MKIKLRAEEVLIIVMVLFALCWFGNAARFLATDFKPSYRCEVIYGMGILVPPLSLATVWVSCDE